MEKKTRENLVVAIAIVGLIVTIIALYLQFRKKEEPPEPPPPPPPPPPECMVDADCPGNQICVNGHCVDPEIPGNPEFWELDEHFPPEKNHTVWFAQPVHLASLTGFYFLLQTCPKCWLKKNAGIKIVANTTTENIVIFTDEPWGGRGEGWHPFSSTPGLSDVTGLTIYISKWYWNGDETLRLTDFIGEMVVFV